MKISVALISAYFVSAIGAIYIVDASAKDIVKGMVRQYRQSVVYLKIIKTSDTGEVFDGRGTGFIVSDKGHILTSCHLVEKAVRDEDGNATQKKIDSVTVSGVIGSSRDTAFENISIIDCAQGNIDLALLKFTNSAKPRKRVPIAAFNPPTYGDVIGAMGFPLEAEFFARDGKFSSEADNDTMLVDMTLNPGDSGAPVFNEKLKVVGIAEAGYSEGARIGVVRPIRYAAVLLTIAGVPVVAANARIASSPKVTSAKESNVEFADFTTAIRTFSAAAMPIETDAKEITLTYPYARRIAETGGQNTSDAASNFNITDIPAKPGYRIVGAKFIVTGEKDAEVIHVGPSPQGNSVRTAIKRSSEEGRPEQGGGAYVKGFVETTQIRINEASDAPNKLNSR